jgi:hypothetical protein
LPGTPSHIRVTRVEVGVGHGRHGSGPGGGGRPAHAHSSSPELAHEGGEVVAGRGAGGRRISDDGAGGNASEIAHEGLEVVVLGLGHPVGRRETGNGGGAAAEIAHEGFQVGIVSRAGVRSHRRRSATKSRHKRLEVIDIVGRLHRACSHPSKIAH